MTRVPVTLRVGFVPHGYAAWVPLRRTILVGHEDYLGDERIIAHELAHVLQIERYGMLRYYWNYLLGWMGSGFSYQNIPMEVEARRLEKEPAMLQWAKDLMPEGAYGDSGY